MLNKLFHIQFLPHLAMDFSPSILRVNLGPFAKIERTSIRLVFSRFVAETVGQYIVCFHEIVIDETIIT